MRSAQLARALPTGEMQPPPSPFLGILPQELWFKKKRTCWVPLNALAIAPGANGLAAYRADPNHTFVGFIACVKVRDNADAAHGALTDMPVLVSAAMEDGTPFQPSGAGQQNELDNLFGSAKEPAIWSLPLIVPAGQQITFTFTNNHNAKTLDIRATVQGFTVAL